MNKEIKVKIKSDYGQIKDAWHSIAELLESLDLADDLLFDIRLSSEEGMVNAIKYGNRFNPKLFVEIAASCNDNKIEISIKDEGKGFDFKSLPDPTTNENLAKPSGRGLYLIKRLMDEVRFNDTGNEITMVKFIKPLTLPSPQRGED